DLGAARKELVAVKGIGPWTAELFLLYARGEMDAFPVADVGLMEAHKRLSDAPARMDRDAFTTHAERWRPWRGVAAHLLWAWLNRERANAIGDSPSD
ncbi:MAG: DNA-3-methyladenine glycosylase 2 family protein, partial [Pseudomonadota bacterium]